MEETYIMTHQLSLLFEYIDKKLVNAGFTRISSRYDCQWNYTDGKFMENHLEKSVYKNGMSVSLEICPTHNSKIEPVSIYLRALKWKDNSTCGKDCSVVRISWKDSRKKRDQLIDQIISHYKNVRDLNN